MTRRGYSSPFILIVAAACLFTSQEASAQLDPLLFIKRQPPNVIIAVDTSNRMLRDTADVYRDTNVYTKSGVALWEPSLGIKAENTNTYYRRKYINLQHTDPASSAGDKFSADAIRIVGDRETARYTTFDDLTKLGLVRKALTEVVEANKTLVRFGLVKTRQKDPVLGSEKNEGPVKSSDPNQSLLTETGSKDKWRITRPEVGSINGLVATSGLMTPADYSQSGKTSNDKIRETLALNMGQANSLTPGGRDGKDYVDAPVDNMLDDARADALRLLTADTQCRQTVVVLIVGGGEGNTTSEDIATKAKSFVDVRDDFDVPIHVIAIAPPAADRASLQQVAENSGGLYTEIEATTNEALESNPALEIERAVAKIIRATNYAVSEAFQNTTEFNVDPTATASYRGPETEHQVTSPIIGTVELEGALDIENKPLVLDVIKTATGTVIPQRSNVLITTGFALPGFEARMRAFRVYRPEVDKSKSSGYKFVSDGTSLWTASVPAAASRNIFTVLPDGTMVAFTAANAAALAPYLSTSDTEGLIEFIRSQPLGPIVGSTPAIMDPPSLDPPPDAEYPGFKAENERRRSIIWVGANDGMFHAIDARLGKEVWAFIPFNLLPKLKTLLHGQPAGSFRYFVDSSPKVADVKVAGEWRTYLVIGQGVGGTFYQTFDVTLDNMADVVAPTENNIDTVLAYFSSPSSVPFKWSFPQYKDFDHTLVDAAHGIFWGDIAETAPAVAKSIGQTWSDPAVGQIENTTGPYAVLTGSGFMPYTMQQAANRAGVVAGTTFYLLNMETGDVFDAHDVGADTAGEKTDSCGTGPSWAVVSNDCTKLKNALQADPVATGPADSRFVSKAYMGDLDGRLWRFDLKLDAAKVPQIETHTKLYDAGAAHPMFSSMATVTVGGSNQYLFQATGSDLLPSNGVSQQYQLLIVKDNGTTGSLATATGKPILMEKVDGVGNDEKVTSFPAVAGDIVFFSTTTFKPAALCTPPDGNLYAFTFIGGPAYDSNNDGRVTTADTAKITTTVGARASAPFIVDQHLVFAAGNKIRMFGDPDDFNNGVGQAGVRILSWREVR
jgi:hypothetical protein